MPRRNTKKERGVFEKDPGSEIWWLLEHFLVNALQDTLHEKLTLPETACDPYMIGYLGRALAARRVSKSLIEQIVRNAPVSLISALSMVGDADPDLICPLLRQTCRPR
jgi:hypothetical protein